MKALIDTNVLLDIIVQREPFVKNSKRIYDLMEQGKIECFISVQSLKDIYYICGKMLGRDTPMKTIEKLSFLFNILDVQKDDVLSTLASDMDDFEDGLLAFSSIRNGVDAIITRNENDFLETNMLIINPKDIDKYFNQ